MVLEDVLEYLVENVPAPEGDREAPLQALIIDSWFDNYLGVVSLVRVKQGQLSKRDKFIVAATGSIPPCEGDSNADAEPSFTYSWQLWSAPMQ